MRTTDTRPAPPETVTYSERGVGHGKIRKMNSRRRLVLFALVLVVAAVAVIAAVATTRGSKTPKAAPATSPTAAAAIAPTSPAPESTAATATAPQLTPPTTAPAGVTWELFEGVALPSSKTDGPTKVAYPLYAGYSDTPVGALLAAAQISSRYVITPTPGWRQVVTQQVLPGAVRDNFVKERAKVSDTPPEGGYAQIAGFRFVTYDNATAVISIATRTASGVLAAGDVTVRWVDDDWRMEFPQASSAPQQLSYLTGYVAWQGVS